MAIELTGKQKQELGILLNGRKETYIKDRQDLEEQMAMDLRQHRGKYDPKIQAALKEAERSQVYPRDTRVKVNGYVAKMMEMMFPAKERNWKLSPSKVPSIDEADLQNLISALEAQAIAAAQEQGVEPQPITSEDIEDAVRVFAQKRAVKLENEIEDQMTNDPEYDYPTICKRALRSGGIYGWGVTAGPMVKDVETHHYERDPASNRYVPVTKTTPVPFWEPRRSWDLYPDLSATSWSAQEGIFDRMVMGRNKLVGLADRRDFDGKALRKWLREHKEGNYVAQTYESDQDDLKHTENVSEKSTRKYELFRYYGFLHPADFERIGAPMPQGEDHMDVLVDVWLLDNVVIKYDSDPFGENVSDQYHAYVYGEDEDSGLTGISLPQDLRDSQMSICSMTRMMMDNAASSAGPIIEVNRRLLGKNKTIVIRPFTPIYRDGDEMAGDANAPALRPIQVDSHTNELMAIIRQAREQLDVESNLPAWLMGSNPQQLGEAFRTSGNMSQMTGGANMVSKDNVRAFDRYVQSIIRSAVKWNMEFNDKTELKGDFEVIPQGTVSLVAKEIRGAALDQFSQTLTPEERALLKTREVLIDKLKSRDLPTEHVYNEEESERILQGMRESAAQAAAIEQAKTEAETRDRNASASQKEVASQIAIEKLPVEVQEILARVAKMGIDGEVNLNKSELDALQAFGFGGASA